VPKEEDHTELGIRPVVVRKNGFYIRFYQSSSVNHRTMSTYVCPETCKAPYEAFVTPLIKSVERGVYRAPSFADREEMLQSFDDDRCVAVDFSADCEDGNFAVLQGECTGRGRMLCGRVSGGD
jgi:hypothetical protein